MVDERVRMLLVMLGLSVAEPSDKVSIYQYIESLPVTQQEELKEFMRNRSRGEPELNVAGETPPCSSMVLDVLQEVGDWEYKGDSFRSRSKQRSGVYAFFAHDKHKEVCLYVGKAFCLHNRIQTNVNRSVWMDRFWQAEADDELFTPLFVRVWFTDNRAGLESTLIDILKPRYNKKRE